MEAVADASAILAVVLDEPERASIVQGTVGVSLVAPEVLPFEIGNALIAMEKRGRVEREAVQEVWRAAGRIAVKLLSVDIEAALSLALVTGTYAYDAYYLQCALSQNRPLVALDRKMRAAANQLGIQLLN
ncbi:MAG: type II toxin-antitoxin system VapC family toxin [Acidobacteriota bacterium]